MGTWKSLGKRPHADVQLLLMDGTVMLWESGRARWRLLRPSADGSYGPGGFGAEAVLPGLPNEPRGGVVLRDGSALHFGVNSAKLQLFDAPSASWLPMALPALKGSQGPETLSAPMLVLPDDQVLFGGYPPAMVRYDPGDPASFHVSTVDGDFGGEFMNPGARVLLPNGHVAALIGSQMYEFNPESGAKTALTTLAKSPVPIGAQSPALLLPDRRILVVSSTSKRFLYFSLPSQTDPLGQWELGPVLPPVDSRGWPIHDVTRSLCLLPSGHVLCGAEYWLDEPVGYQALVPYELDPGSDSLSSQEYPDFVRHEHLGYFEEARRVTFLVLPTGQVLVSMITDPSVHGLISHIYLYTEETAPIDSLRPVVTTPAPVNIVGTATIEGKRFNGCSQAVSHLSADTTDFDASPFSTQNASNYPVVQFTNDGGDTIFYLPTVDVSSMGVAAGSGKLTCSVGPGVPNGAGKLRIIVNGLASDWVDATVRAVNHEPYAEEEWLVLRLLGGGEEGMIAVTPHGIVKVPGGDPVIRAVRDVRSRLSGELRKAPTPAAAGSRRAPV